MFSNDPKKQKVELSLKAEVVEEVRVTPKFINFGEVPTGEESTATLTLEVLEPKKVSVSSVTCEDKRFVPRMSTSTDATSVWKIRFSGSDQKGPINAAVVIRIEGDSFSWKS